MTQLILVIFQKESLLQFDNVSLWCSCETQSVGDPRDHMFVSIFGTQVSSLLLDDPFFSGTC